MDLLKRPHRGLVIMRGLLAAASLALFAAATPAEASQAPAPGGGYYQSYLVRPRAYVHSIVLYQTTFDSTGLTNSFEASPPSTLITDPFLKEKPIDQTYFLGVTEFGDPSPDAAQHLVLAFNNAFAHSVLAGGQDFADLFPGYNEGGLIDALVLLSTPDLAPDDPGHDAQLQAKDDAVTLLFNFSATVATDGGTFGQNDPFKMVAFSTPTEYGDGVAAARPAAVPEPSAWAVMILGFGGAGWLLRRRRDRDGFALA